MEEPRERSRKRSWVLVCGILVLFGAIGPGSALGTPGRAGPDHSRAAEAASLAPTPIVGNSGFETDLSGWRPNAGTSLARVEPGHTGSFAAALTRTGSTGNVRLNDHRNWLRSAPGDAICTASASVLGPEGETARIRLREYRLGVRVARESTATVLDGAWQVISVPLSVMHEGDNVDLNVYGVRFDTGGTVLVDDVSILCARTDGSGELVDLVEGGTREQIRAWADARSIADINLAVAGLDDARKARLAEIVLDTDATGTERDRFLRLIGMVLSHPDLGFYAEIWSYTFIEMVEGGFFGTCGHLFLSPSAFASLSDTDARNVLMHESFHSFNCVNRGPVGALDEGAAIWIFKATLAESLHPAETWAEATYGTKLFYRDIVGSPDYPLGVAAAPTDKLLEVYRWLADLDPSRLPWNSQDRLTTCFQRYWEPLDRNVDFFAVWLPSAEAATGLMLADPDCRPV